MGYTYDMNIERFIIITTACLTISIPLISLAQTSTTTTTPINGATSTATTTGPLATTSDIGTGGEDRPYVFLAGPHCLQLSRNLILKSRGTDVKSLQAELVLLGFLQPQDVTGIYGSTTQVAVIQFQSTYNIGNSLDGRVGPLTRNFFKALCPKPVIVYDLPAIKIHPPEISSSTSTDSEKATSTKRDYSRGTSNDAFIGKYTVDPLPPAPSQLYSGNCIGTISPDLALLNTLLGTQQQPCSRYHWVLVPDALPILPLPQNEIPSRFRINVSTSTPGTVIITTGPQ